MADYDVGGWGGGVNGNFHLSFSLPYSTMHFGDMQGGWGVTDTQNILNTALQRSKE